MNEQTTRRLAAGAMTSAAGLAIAGFTALGSIFDYPTILKEPTAHILSSYREHQGAVSSWFLVLVVGAALLGPVGVLLGRLAGGRRGRLIAGLGVAAAAVQVVGLSRWVLLVPQISDDAREPAHAADARHRFEVIHTWLGTVLGETIGYALTATFTVVAVAALGAALRPRWVAVLGYGSAALISTGVLIPVGLDAASVTNFAGYVLWCIWLLVMAKALWQSPGVPVRSVRRTASPSPT